jgi:ribosomal protein S27E
MSRAIDLTGQRFERLLVLERAERRYNTTNAFWKCQCDCGEITVVNSNALRRGKTKSCGCLSAENTGRRSKYDLHGRRFGMLSVVSETEHPSARSHWRCLCDCGQETTVQTANLTSGHTRSCGCYGRNKNLLPDSIGGFNRLLDKYKRRARKEGRDFQITAAEFREITQQSCAYCGVPTTRISAAKTAGNHDQHAYIYNGVDRVDNALGYVRGNCAPCCVRCNRMKRDMSLTDFLEHIRRIAAFTKTLPVPFIKVS